MTPREVAQTWRDELDARLGTGEITFEEWQRGIEKYCIRPLLKEWRED